MAKRPTLSEDSFLGFLFSPSKHPQPAGIRKRTLKGVKGQKKGRIAAFNRMTPVKQELLKRSGKQDAYLRGEATLADAKNALRPTAIAKNLAKPLRPKAQPAYTQTALDIRIARYIIRKLDGKTRKPVNTRTVYSENQYLGDNADEGMLVWSEGDIKHAGRRGSEYETVDASGNTHNPFWYH